MIHRHPSCDGRPELDRLEADGVPRIFRTRISHRIARRHLLLATGEDDQGVDLAVAEMTEMLMIQNVSLRLEQPVRPWTAEAESLAAAIDRVYAGAVMAEVEPIEDPGDVARLLQEAESDVLRTHGKAPVVRLVDAMLLDALQRGASDVHLQPLAEQLLVRYRVDGVLQTVQTTRSATATSIVSRIKVMADMDIAESRLPQDGRTSIRLGARAVDLRVSTLPTIHGERVVVRLLDQQPDRATLAQLGMPEDVERRYIDAVTRSRGMILLTGPTGSGKTTTLYATLRELADGPASNIMTIEDPIEYELSRVGLPVSQSQVNLRKGITFATGLRHMLRQDPDVVMVGEIRDEETAQIAVQSSLTGHLVLSTLHTNDAPSAIARLVDLGIEPSLMRASLGAIVAQRLVRLLHNACRARGCDACVQTGFRGRAALYELLLVDDNIRALIGTRMSVAAIRAAAAERGARTLIEEGRRLVETGRTTAWEVDRVVRRKSGV